MKKFFEALKANRTLLIILVIVFALIAVVVVFYDDDVSAGAQADKTSTEVKIESMLSRIDGVGENEVFVTETDGEIEGIVVVCSGADSIMTRNDIINALSTILDINKNIIAVYAMN